jgi:flagellum-specific peptidoglycan hydrolase FlgJ
MDKRAWIEDIAAQAAIAGHIFSQMAAAEAALESNFGQSRLAQEGNNLFGMKQHQHPVYGTLSLPTREFLTNQWQVVEADFVKYPAIVDCFVDRMATLVRLKNAYVHYKNALTASDPDIYIEEVSKSWSTDPNRAESVRAIYDEFFVGPPPNMV